VSLLLGGEAHRPSFLVLPIQFHLAELPADRLQVPDVDAKTIVAGGGNLMARPSASA
jgi:hypothetical protein